MAYYTNKYARMGLTILRNAAPDLGVTLDEKQQGLLAKVADELLLEVVLRLIHLSRAYRLDFDAAVTEAHKVIAEGCRHHGQLLNYYQGDVPPECDPDPGPPVP